MCAASQVITENHHTRRAIANVLVLRTTQLDHALGCRMLDINLCASVGDSRCMDTRALARAIRTSRKMACPSLVIEMPPIGSSIILSIAFGPKHVRMASATACVGECAHESDCVRVVAKPKLRRARAFSVARKMSPVATSHEKQDTHERTTMIRANMK